MDILKYTKYLVLISILIIISGFYIIFNYGFKTSIEYTGGTVITFKVPEDFNETKFKESLNSLKIEDYEIFRRNSLIEFKIPESDSFEVIDVQNNILKLNEGIEVESLETVGPEMGMEFAKNSLLAVSFSLLAIVIFITYSFYNLPDKIASWKFGIAAIVAMLHDVLVVLAFFSIGGYFFNIEIDALFLTAILTIIGFSINDTIVVFDRVRENLIKYTNKLEFKEICNISILETINRSLITSFTVIFIMFSLFLLGGESIKYFALSLVIGITAGTYSSIFIATPFVLFLNRITKK